MLTLQERLRHSIALREISQNQLEIRAGMARGQVSRLLSGSRGSDVTVDTIAKLARALGVSATWLGFGEGVPPLQSATAPDPLPNRAEAIDIVRRGGLPQAAVDEVMKTEHPGQEEWSTLQWINAFQLAASMLRSPTLPPPATVAPAESHQRPKSPHAPPSTRRSIR